MSRLSVITQRTEFHCERIREIYMVTLEEISQLLYGAGEEMPGWQGTEDELIALSAKIFPGKAFCVVRQWILIDLTVNSDEKEKLTGLGLFPATLFAHEIVLDSKGRFQPCGYAVISESFSRKAACLKPTVPSTSSGDRALEKRSVWVPYFL